MGEYLSDKIRAYIQGRAEEKLKKGEDSSGKFLPSVWLADASRRASQVNIVTHPLKFTNTDAKGTSVLASLQNQNKEHLPLSTLSIASYELDVDGNAAALDVAKLLLLSDGKEQLWQALSRGDYSALEPFSSDRREIEQWVQGLLSALTTREIKSSTRSKQIYFPVGEGKYHLLSPLFASSLSSAIVDRVTKESFSDEGKAARKAKKENTYYPKPVVRYPNLLVQSFGGTKPQNVSLLNSAKGRFYAVPSMPPIWKDLGRPKASNSDWFWYRVRPKCRNEVSLLKEFLEKHRESDSTIKIRARRQRLEGDVVGAVMNFAAEIQTHKGWSGWSAESSLPTSEQFWLDPFREEGSFQASRAEADWERLVAEKFARWLTRELKSENLTFGDAEFVHWRDLFEVQLKEAGV